jgi:hypothetical protein
LTSGKDLRGLEQQLGFFVFVFLLAVVSCMSGNMRRVFKHPMKLLQLVASAVINLDKETLLLDD